jgi:outer membrane receptor protein involved in Fe transport
MMRYRLLLIAFFTLSFSAGIFAQNIIQGRVYDRERGEPLAGVYVIYGISSGTSTDSTGYYRILSDSSRLSVTFQFIGYKPVSRQLTLRNGELRTLNIELETETREIDQIVVSADRTSQKLSDITVSADVIKSDFILHNHITEATELITKTTGIEVLDGQASIRGGSGFSYGVGSRVMALVDGLPLLSPDAGGIRWQYLPMENIAQVEVIKGASSVMYGSSALNGIISFRTADAGNIPSTKFIAETGIYMKPVNDEWVWWKGPRIFSTLSFSHLRKIGNSDVGVTFNLFDDNSYRKDNDEILGKFGFKFKRSDKKVSGLNYGVNLSSGLTAKTDFLLWQDADNALVQDTSSVAYLKGKFLAIDPFISYGKRGLFRHDIRMRIQSSENRFPVKIQNNSKTFSIYSEYQLWLRVSEKIDITGGVSETWYKVTSNFFGDHNSINLAFFTQAEYRPVPRLKIVAGVRAEENILDSEQDKIVPVIRTGINWQVAGYTFLRGSFGQGYRFPSIAEKYASTTLGTVKIFPNPYVMPESGWSSEAGVKQGLKIGSITGQADLSFFLSQNQELIEYEFGLFEDPYTGLVSPGFQATNLERSRIYGSELELAISKPFGKMNMTISGGYTYIHPTGNYNSGNAFDTWLKYRRKHAAQLILSAGWKKVDLSVSFYARSKILNIDDVFLNPLSREMILPGFYDYWQDHNTGYFLMDAGAGYKISDKFDISFTVKNLTNTEYMGRPGDIQPPRNISLRLSGTF